MARVSVCQKNYLPEPIESATFLCRTDVGHCYGDFLPSFARSRASAPPAMTAAPRLESRKRDSRAAKNPHAEGIPPEELSSLVEEFYGTRTLVFDRAFAEAVLTYNT